MREEHIQRELDFMEGQTKIARTTCTSLINRWILVKEYNHWYISVNEYPHLERGAVQLVLWRRDWLKQDAEYEELEEIFREYGRYNIYRSPDNNMSVGREHFHIYSDPILYEWN